MFHTYSYTGRSLRGKKKCVCYTQFAKKAHRLVAIGGLRLVAEGGGRRQLVVGDWWLAVGGCWRLVVGGWWSVGGVLIIGGNPYFGSQFGGGGAKVL